MYLNSFFFVAELSMRGKSNELHFHVFYFLHQHNISLTVHVSIRLKARQGARPHPVSS